MAESFKDKLEDAGNTISETASKVGHAVSEKAEAAKDWAKETVHKAEHGIDEMKQKAAHASSGTPLAESHGATGSTADIKEHMEVYASCGKKVGKVDHVQGDQIKLTKDDSPDGQHHLIPLSWVAKVHDHIHLDRDHMQVESGWKSA